MLPKVIPVNGHLMIDMHGDGKVVCNVSMNEAFALFEQLIVHCQPRTHQTSESLSDA